MGLPVEVNNLMLGSLGGYTVGRSLRFRSSATAYLNRTPSSTGNRQKFTWSGWVKRGLLTTGTYYQLFGAGGASTNEGIFFDTSAGGIYFTVDGGTTATVTSAVFRDPSAWYHIVAAIDTTQATASNRIIVYINGIQQTSYTGGYPAQNTNFTFINVGSTQHRIGAHTNSGYYFDGYMAEVNFIDGQQLTPSSFGAYDTNGVWQPKKYSGTYGTNGFYLPFSANTTSAYATYQSDSSGTYNTLPSGSQGSTFQFPGDFTVEGWVLYTSASSGDGSVYVINDGGSNYFAFNVSMSAGVYNIYCNSGVPTASFSHGIQAGVWTHIALVRSGSTITAYTNGVAKGTITNSATLGYSSIGFNRLGGGVVGIPRYMSNIRVVKSAVYTSAFTPPTSPLTAIANTLFLTYQNSTAIDNGPNAFTLGTAGSPTFSVQYPFAVNIANDASGNGNNWTPNNISLINGTTYDSMIDSPTNAAGASTGIGNYAVMNPNFVTPSTTFSNGNLTLTKTGNTDVVATSTIAMPSGKWYWEITITSLSASSDLGIGIVKNTTTNGSWVGALPAGVYFNSGGGVYRYGSNITGTLGTTFATNDILGLALDMDAGTLALYKNNTLIYTVSGVDTTTPHYAFWDSYANGESASFNFGQRPFTYTPPSGYKALNTYNLPAPSIANGAQYMAASLWTGDATTPKAVVSNLSFSPDFVWIKDRSVGYQHSLQDIVRGTGASKKLYSSLTEAENGANSVYGHINSFDANGFTVATGSSGAQHVNANGVTYVGWSWKAGGTGVTNTSGTITSTVSASPSSGFSIATFTGTGANATVGHGLSVAPNMIFTKQRNATGQWNVYHSSLGNGNVIYLNLTNAANPDNTYWNATSPTANVFTIGTNVNVNTNGTTYVAYCFSAVSGYSAFGKYTGNGSSDGPFIYTGFRPRFVMIKGSSFVSNWNLNDSSRSLYNLADLTLRPNLSGAEFTSSGSGFALDFLSNGFKLRANYIDSNSSGDTFIYAAFAENPFNSSRAR